MPARFERPPKASHHCRHYSFVLPIDAPDSGPRCALGFSLTGIGASRMCMPGEAGACSGREEYTEAERDAWKQAVEESKGRLVAAIQALPRPIPLSTDGAVACPSCGGRLAYARWHRGAFLQCETENCCGARFSIEAGKDWPAS